MSKVKVGFIGAGDIAELHGRSLRGLDSAELLGIWNITAELSRQKADIFHCRIYESAEALVNDPGIDAVFVLTSLEAHHKYTLMALEAGKHVYVEKPVGVTIQEIQAMQQTADKMGKICMPGHNYIYEAGVQRARELIDAGKLGDLVSLYVMYNIHHPEEVAARFPGVIRQILTHHGYITLYLGGVPIKVSAMKSVIHYEKITQEDLAMATLKLASGALVHWCASFAADDHAGDPWTMMIKVIGTKGAARYSYRDWVENTPAQVHSQTYSAYPYTIYNAGRYFIEECILGGKKPLSTLEDAIKTQEVIEAIELSIEEERHISL